MNEAEPLGLFESVSYLQSGVRIVLIHPFLVMKIRIVYAWVWRDDLVVTSNGGSSRGPGFGFQHPYNHPYLQC